MPDSADSGISFASKKCGYARKWRIPVVNFLWLEDCYLEQKPLPLDDARYSSTNAPSRRLGERPFVFPGDLEGKAANEGKEAVATANPPVSLFRTSRQDVRQASPSTKRRQVSLSLSPSRYRQPPDKKVRIDGDGAQAFETVSASSRDDSQQIANVSRTIKKGAGIPRLTSVEEL
jgi:hypothetical protein